MTELSINYNTCITCGKCIRVCPASIFYRTPDAEEVKTQNESACIRCGHCVAICPADSVIHNYFPPEKVHMIDSAILPTAGQLDVLIKARRSNRAFSSKSVPKDHLEQILEAAHRAPTASNGREVSFTVVTHPDKLKFISAYTMEALSKMIRAANRLKPLLKLFRPDLVALIPMMEARKKAFYEGRKDTVLRGARAVIFFHTPEAARFGKEDANLAYQNASLVAESLGVAQFYTGYVCSVKNKQGLCRELGITGEIYAGMALGIPAFRFEKYIDKEPVKVNWVE